MGLIGVWIGILVSILLESAILVLWFRRGSWLHREV